MPLFEPITPANAARLTEIARVRCGFITDLAWSSDGSTLAVAHGAGVWLWASDFGGTPGLRLPADAPVKALAFSPGGKTLATAGSDTFVRLWDLESAACTLTISGHQSSVDGVAFSPDGTLIASCGADRTIRLIDPTHPTHARVLTGHEDEVTCVAFDSSGRVVSGSRDATVRVWTPVNAREQMRLTGHTSWVRNLAVSRDGRVASAGRDATVRIHSLDTGAEIAVLTHEGDARAVAFSPDSRLIASGDLQTLCLWDSVTGTSLARLPGHDRPILALAFHPNGALLASGSGDNTARLWAVTESKGRPD